jgi:hypothetical protein
MHDTTRKERNDIVTTLLVAGILAVIALVLTVLRFVDTFTTAGVAVGVPFAAAPAQLRAVDSRPATTVQVTEALLVAESVNPISQVALAVSIAVGGLAWLGVIGCFAALALRFLRGRFFDAGNIRLLDGAVWTMFGGALAVYALETLGRNGVLAATGLGDYSVPSWAVTAPFVPIWIAAMVLGLIAIAFRRGIRLQRDTEGLV